MPEHVVVFIHDRENNKLLLAHKKRSFGMGKWNGPGGKFEPGETIEEAMIRECQEEIGITPTSYHKAAELTLHEYHEGQAYNIFAHAFVCHNWEGTPTETDEMAPAWFLMAKLPYENMWADDPYWLPGILKGQKLVGEFWLSKDDKIVKHVVKRVKNFA